MIGTSQAEALQLYLELVRRPVSCVAPAFPDFSEDTTQAGRSYTVTLGAYEPLLLLVGNQLLRLSIRQRIELVEHTEARRAERWHMHGRAYAYDVSEAETGREIIAFHWQPRAGRLESEPHAHVKQAPALLAKAHIPAACMTAHLFVRFLIAELGVESAEPGWESALDGVERRIGAINARGARTWTCERGTGA